MKFLAKITVFLLSLVALKVELSEGRFSVDEDILGALKKASRRVGSVLRPNRPGKHPLQIDEHGLFRDEDAVVAPVSGKKLYELDMVLREEEVDSMIRKKPRRQKRAAIINNLWDSKVIPYTIATHQFSQSDLNLIDESMARWSEATCITFRPKTSSDTAYLNILGNNDGCWSYVGRTGGVQNLNLENPGCIYLYTIMHELGHAMGLYHEQSRTDRDDYVTVLWNNIWPGKSNNFNKFDGTQIDSRGWAYDYRSVMHYGKNYFSMGGDTLQTTDPYYQDIIGKAPYISFRDAAVINDMYNCQEGCPPVTCPGPESYVGKDCKCYCPSNENVDIVQCTGDTTDDCAGNPCQNGGVCTDIGTTYTCACTSGYSGTNCEIADTTDDCAGNPCQNGGVCTDIGTTYTCDCANGYSGTNCETADYCASAPCKNGGTCSNTASTFSCQCQQGYSGTTCETVTSCTDSGDALLCLLLKNDCANIIVAMYCQATCNMCF